MASNHELKEDEAPSHIALKVAVPRLSTDKLAMKSSKVVDKGQAYPNGGQQPVGKGMQSGTLFTRLVCEPKKGRNSDKLLSKQAVGDQVEVALEKSRVV